MTIKQKTVRKITNKEAGEWVSNRLIHLNTSMKDVFTVMRILRAKLTLVDINCEECGTTKNVSHTLGRVSSLCDDCMSNEVAGVIKKVRKDNRKENKGKNKRGSKRKNKDYWHAC